VAESLKFGWIRVETGSWEGAMSVVVRTDMCSAGGRLVTFAGTGVITGRAPAALPCADNRELR
jgi:hypothetical protein